MLLYCPVGNEAEVAVIDFLWLRVAAAHSNETEFEGDDRLVGPYDITLSIGPGLAGQFVVPTCSCEPSIALIAS